MLFKDWTAGVTGWLSGCRRLRFDPDQEDLAQLNKNFKKSKVKTIQWLPEEGDGVKEHKECFGCYNVWFLHLGTECMSVFSLWKFGIYTFRICAFFCLDVIY